MAEREEKQQPCEMAQLSCDIEKTGVCAFHNVEVERRKNMNELVQSIPKLLTAMNRTIGVLTFVGLVIAASFIYTRDTDQSAINRDQLLEQRISDIAAQVSRLSTAVQVSEAKQAALVLQLTQLNEHLRIVIKNEANNDNQID
jgi:arginine utilization protein RocB